MTGARGLLGSVLLRIGAEVVADGTLDVTDADAVDRILRDVRPRAVIHCAAFTRVDACGPAHFGVNVGAPQRFAERVPTWLVSTNYVFDGPGPHAPGDPRRPCMPYGEQKAQAEDRVLAAGGHVVRSGWIYAPHGHNFPSRLPALLRQGPVKALEAWPVQPTWAADLAAYLLTLPTGLTHAIGGEQTTWADFARACAAKMGLPPSRVQGLDRIPGMGPRPQDARLVGHLLPGFTERLEQLLGPLGQSAQ